MPTFKYRWYGSGPDRGYHIFLHQKPWSTHGERFAFLGEKVSSKQIHEMVEFLNSNNALPV